MRSLIGASVLVLAVVMAAGLALAADDNPGGGPPPRQGDGNGPGGPGGGGPGGREGRGGPQAGFHLIPRFAMEKLELTDDQKKQIADLEKETKDKLGKILTADQMKTLEEARPPRRGGQGGGPDGGGQGGPGGRPPGGPDGQGGGDNSNRPQRPQN